MKYESKQHSHLENYDSIRRQKLEIKYNPRHVYYVVRTCPRMPSCRSLMSLTSSVVDQLGDLGRSLATGMPLPGSPVLKEYVVLKLKTLCGGVSSFIWQSKDNVEKI